MLGELPEMLTRPHDLRSGIIAVLDLVQHYLAGPKVTERGTYVALVALDELSRLSRWEGDAPPRWSWYRCPRRQSGHQLPDGKYH